MLILCSLFVCAFQLVDLPFIVWGSVLLLTGPRGVLLLRDIVKHCENNRYIRHILVSILSLHLFLSPSS